MKKFVLAIMITVSTMGSAQAWGDREQGALAGLIVGAIAHRAFSQPQQTGYPPVQQGQQIPTQQYPVYSPNPQIIVQAPPVIYQQTPMQRVCDTFPQFDVYGRFHGNRTICRTVPY
jgi:hypothetical protein